MVQANCRLPGMRALGHGLEVLGATVGLSPTCSTRQRTFAVIDVGQRAAVLRRNRSNPAGWPYGTGDSEGRSLLQCDLFAPAHVDCPVPWVVLDAKRSTVWGGGTVLRTIGGTAHALWDARPGCSVGGRCHRVFPGFSVASKLPSLTELKARQIHNHDVQDPEP